MAEAADGRAALESVREARGAGAAGPDDAGDGRVRVHGPASPRGAIARHPGDRPDRPAPVGRDHDRLNGSATRILRRARTAGRRCSLRCAPCRRQRATGVGCVTPVLESPYLQGMQDSVESRAWRDGSPRPSWRAGWGTSSAACDTGEIRSWSSGMAIRWRGSCRCLARRRPRFARPCTAWRGAGRADPAFAADLQRVGDCRSPSPEIRGPRDRYQRARGRRARIHDVGCGSGHARRRASGASGHRCAPSSSPGFALPAARPGWPPGGPSSMPSSPRSWWSISVCRSPSGGQSCSQR